MAKPLIETTNTKEILRRLRKLSNTVQKQALIGSMLDGAEVIRRQTASNAPRPSKRRHPHVKRLADSIIKTVMQHKGGKIEIGVMPDYRIRGMTGDEASGARAAHLVEFGHKIVRGGKIFGEVPEHPFFRPAFDATKDIAIQVIRGKLRQSIERETRKLNKD